jgi:hypothetical protein
VLGGAECLAGHGDDVRLVQQAVASSVGADAAFADEGADVGVDVEGALGLGAGDAGNLGQLGEHVVAQLDELGAELGRRTPASRRARRWRPSAPCWWRWRWTAIAACSGWRRPPWGQGEAGAPAGHGVGLGERAEDDHVLLGPGERAAGDGLALVVQVHVALVEQQVDAALVGQVDDALQVFGGDDGAGGVRRRVENDGLGARRDGLLDGIGGDAEVLRFAGLEEDDLAAGVLDDVFEADPVGDGQDDFVAVIDEDLDGVEEGSLPPVVKMASSIA